MKKIGLKEFIDQIKTELTEVSTSDPIFAIQGIDLEISITVTKGGNGKLDFQVVSLGGEYSREDVHSVKLTLQPLISIDELDQDLTAEQKAKAKRVLMRGDE